MESNKVIDALLGVAVGDAVGVPFEFSSRNKMKSNPAQGIPEYWVVSIARMEDIIELGIRLNEKYSVYQS